jgi:hypothetical protein
MRRTAVGRFELADAIQWLSGSVSTRAFLAALVASLVFGFGSAVALAGTAYSADGFYTINGIDYYDYAGIHTDHANNHKAHASTTARSLDGNLPSGWIGALPQRRDSSGALLCTGTWFYNSGSSAGIGTVGCMIYNHSIYSSKGQTRGWNGSGYTTYNTFLSPNQNS